MHCCNINENRRGGIFFGSPGIMQSNGHRAWQSFKVTTFDTNGKPTSDYLFEVIVT